MPDTPLSRLAAACHRHRVLVVLAWIAATAIAITLAVLLGAPSASDFGSIGTDSGRAQTQLQQHFPQRAGNTLTLAAHAETTVDDPAARARIEQAISVLAKADHVTQVISPYTAANQVAPDRHTAYATAILSGTPAPAEITGLITDLRSASGQGVTFALGGPDVNAAETPGGGAADGVGLAAAAIVLLIAFGSVLAMVLPIITAVVGIALGLSGLFLLQNVFPTPAFAPILATIIGLGVGVDYALFVVTRYREALRDGQSPERATVLATATAGRAVLFAGGTVVIGLLGLLLVRLDFLRGVAIGSALTVLMTMAAAVTLLPALLGFTGARIDRVSVFRRRSSRPPLAARWAGTIARRPLLATVLAGLLLILLAAPVLALRLSMPDASTQPRDTSGYATHRMLADAFGPGFDATLVAVVDLPQGNPASVAATVAALPGVAAVSPPQESPDHAVALIAMRPTTGTQDPATTDLVKRIRTATAGQPVLIGGSAAAAIDFATLTADRLPLIITVVVGLSLLLLIAIFRAIPLALKAALLNLLSIGASFGVLVAVLQWGWLHRALNFPTTMPVTAWVPMIMFPVLFGLSMDYEVFLITRIRESYDQTGNTRTAVHAGLTHTARVITAAAAIMVVVFLSVMLGADIGVKQLGLGLAVAVLVDATLVRLILVPAAMELLGRLNWWLPTWLDRALPKLHPEPEPAH
jgi:uncharacterized membrane protein YdfJ with MMPL/SSD domain